MAKSTKPSGDPILDKAFNPELTGDDAYDYEGCTSCVGCLWAIGIAVAIVGIIIAFIYVMRQLGWPNGW